MISYHECIVNIDDRRKSVLGRIKVEDRTHPFKIKLQRQPHNPKNTVDHKVFVDWVPVKQHGRSAQAVFSDKEKSKVKSMAIDGYLAPKIFYEISVQFETGGVSKYVYFKVWLIEPSKLLQAQGQDEDHQEEHKETSSEDSSARSARPNSEYGVKFTIHFGKDNYDAASL